MWSSRSDSSCGDAGDRDAGPHRDDLGDLLLVDRRLVAATCACHSARSVVDRLARRSPRPRAGVAASSYSWSLIAASFSFVIALELLLRLAQARAARTRGAGGRATAASSIRSIALSGQVAVGDVADRQVGRGA